MMYGKFTKQIFVNEPCLKIFSFRKADFGEEKYHAAAFKFFRLKNGFKLTSDDYYKNINDNMINNDNMMNID